MNNVKAKDLKVGDIFYECEYGSNLKMEVVKPVSVREIDPFGDGIKSNQYSWVAKNLTTNELVNYTLTEGFEHYGPRLYDQPQYIYRNKETGELEYRLS